MGSLLCDNNGTFFFFNVHFLKIKFSVKHSEYLALEISNPVFNVTFENSP